MVVSPKPDFRVFRGWGSGKGKIMNETTIAADGYRGPENATHKARCLMCSRVTWIAFLIGTEANSARTAGTAGHTRSWKFYICGRESSMAISI